MLFIAFGLRHHLVTVLSRTVSINITFDQQSKLVLHTIDVSEYSTHHIPAYDRCQWILRWLLPGTCNLPTCDSWWCCVP